MAVFHPISQSEYLLIAPCHTFPLYLCEFPSIADSLDEYFLNPIFLIDCKKETGVGVYMSSLFTALFVTSTRFLFDLVLVPC